MGRTSDRASRAYCDLMVARQETHPGSGAAGTPREFTRSSGQPARRDLPARGPLRGDAGAPADRSLRDRAVRRRDRRRRGGRRPAASIVLHDPAGNDAWEGTFRCVAYCPRRDRPRPRHRPAARPTVGWSWLTDALRAHGAEYVAESGTVTRVATESYGGDGRRAGQRPGSRSGPPGPRVDTADLSAHAEAWGELMCTAGGLEPVPDGRRRDALARRGQRGGRPADG